MKKILLTFDVEEFDLPRILGNPLQKQQEFEVSRQGLQILLELLNKYGIRSTFFTTADFAKKYPALIHSMSKEAHEIACHGYCHSDSCVEDLSRIPLAKKEIEKIIKKPIQGFRAPRFDIKDIDKLSDFGFVYDSSLHPTYIPGKYMNLHKKRKIHKIGNVIEIPPSVLPLIRLPIFWLAFKNFGFPYSKLFTKTNFFSSDYTMLLLHPWEFTDLKNIRLPRYMKRKHSNELLNLFEKYIKFTRKKYGFETVGDYLEYTNF